MGLESFFQNQQSDGPARGSGEECDSKIVQLRAEKMDRGTAAGRSWRIRRIPGIWRQRALDAEKGREHLIIVFRDLIYCEMKFLRNAVSPPKCNSLTRYKINFRPSTHVEQLYTVEYPYHTDREGIDIKKSTYIIEEMAPARSSPERKGTATRRCSTPKHHRDTRSASSDSLSQRPPQKIKSVGPESFFQNQQSSWLRPCPRSYW